MATTYARALYDFAGDGNNLLPLTTGDLIIVTEQRDDGWWGGVANGRTGFFPANYVEVVSDPNAPVSTQAPNYSTPYNTAGANTGGTNYGSNITAATAGATAGAAGAYALSNHTRGLGAIPVGDKVYAGTDEYIIEEERWYLREKRPRRLFCGAVLSKWQYRLFILNAIGLFQIAFILIVILVIAPALIKFLVAGSVLRFDALTITNPSDVNDSFVLRASATLSNAGPFDANVDPSNLSLYYINPDGSQSLVGSSLLASLHISGVTHFTQTVLFNVQNVTGLALFNQGLINSKSVNIQVSARPRVTPVLWDVDWELPFHYSNIPLDKTLNLRSFNGLKQVNVTKFLLSSSTSTQVIADVGVDIFNPSIFSIVPIGILSVDFYYEGQILGRAHTNELAIITLGTFHIDLTGVITAKNLTALDGLIQRYLSGESTVVNAVSTPGSESSISLFAPGLAGFTLATLTPGFTQGLVSSISFNSLSISPDSYDEAILFSADLTLVANSPEGSQGYFAISALTLQAEILNTKNEIIGILTTTQTAYPTPIYPQGTNVTSTFNVQIQNAYLDVTGHEQAYLDFVYEFSQAEAITLSNNGVSNVIITIVLGQLPVSGLKISATSVTPGLQALNTTHVNSIGVSGVSSCADSGGINGLCGLHTTTTATATNPSVTTVNLARADLGLYFECVRLGTLTAEPLLLVPGYNTLSLAGFILPPQDSISLEIAGVFFSNYLNGFPSLATIRGDPVPSHYFKSVLPNLPGCSILGTNGNGLVPNVTSACCECGECTGSQATVSFRQNAQRALEAYHAHQSAVYDSAADRTRHALTSSPHNRNKYHTDTLHQPELTALDLTVESLSVTTTILFPPQKLLLGADILYFGLIFDPQCNENSCPIYAATSTNVLFGLPPGTSFPLQALSTSAVLNIYYQGVEAVSLTVPQTPVTQYHTRGPSVPPTYEIPDTIQLTLTHTPIVIDTFTAFSGLTAQLLNSQHGTIHIESLTDPIASTAAGNLPLYSIPLVTDVTLSGFNSFQDATGQSLITVHTLDILAGQPNFLEITTTLTIQNPSNVFLVNGQTITFDLWYTSVQGHGTQRVGNVSIPNFGIANPKTATTINNYVGYGYFDPPAIQAVGAEFLGNYVNRIASTVVTTGATCNLVHDNGAGGCNSVALPNIIGSPLYGVGTTIPLLKEGTRLFETTIVVPGLNHPLVTHFYLDLGALLGSLFYFLENPALLGTTVTGLLNGVIGSIPGAPSLPAVRRLLSEQLPTAKTIDTVTEDDLQYLMSKDFTSEVEAFRSNRDLILALHHYESIPSWDGNNKLKSMRHLLQLQLGSTQITDLLTTAGALVKLLSEGLIALNSNSGINNPPLSIPTQIQVNNSFSVPLQLVAGNLTVYSGTPSAANPPIATYIHNIDLANSQCQQPIVPAHTLFVVPCVYVNSGFDNFPATITLLTAIFAGQGYISAIGTLTARIGGPGGFLYTIPADSINVPSTQATCPTGTGLDCGCGNGNNVCGTQFTGPYT